ncbi:MAG: polysaccharide biosynthesis C-terminal domain-containing protein, partial [Bacteroidaceae bacterium]|nr:polysaccharide biosynthesis C-terminal domain-containing protein [Bacteroidaceae bacterium]
RAFGASDTTLPYAADFLRIILWGNIITQLFYGLNAQLRSTQRPRLAMNATIGSVVVNAALGALFIFGFGWGIRGAALATVLAQASMLMWQLYLFSNPADTVHLQRATLRPRWRIVREAITIGLPQLLLNACAALVGIIVMRSMARYGGDTAVGAFGIVSRLMMLIVFVVIGLNQGMQPIAGYNYGAGRYDRVKSVARLTIIAATCVTSLGALAAWTIPEILVAPFAKDAPHLIEASAHGLRIATAMFPFVGLQIVSSALFQSIGIPGKSIFLSLTRQVIFLIPGLLLIPHLWHDPMQGVWLAMPISDGAAAALSAWLVWKQMEELNKSEELSVES